MSISPEDPLEQLRIADPTLFVGVSTALKKNGNPIPTAAVAMAVADMVWALSLESSFGEAVAEGYVTLLPEMPPAILIQYRNAVRAAGQTGPILGRIVAQHLPPVLKFKDPTLTKRFYRTVETLLKKGIHLLSEPLSGVSRFLIANERIGGEAFLDLLQVVFSTELTYNRARALSHLLPIAVGRFSSTKRGFQVREVLRVAKLSCDLVDAFLTGIEAGLDLLSEEALREFVSTGVEKYHRNKGMGKAFLSLESEISRRQLADLQVSVSLSQVKPSLARYLRARTGGSLSVKPLSALPAAVLDEHIPPLVCSDSRFIYLPEEIGIFGTRNENLILYKLLARLESGYHEFGTFDFDLEKLTESLPWGCFKTKAPFDVSDMERFFLSFPCPDLARDLFTVFENGRLRLLMEHRYPGLLRQAEPLLIGEVRRLLQAGTASETGAALLAETMLGKGHAAACGIAEKITRQIEPTRQLFDSLVRPDPVPETCGRLVIECFRSADVALFAPPLPFGRRVRPDLFRRSDPEAERLSRKIKAGLDAKNIKVYHSDILRHFNRHRQLTAQDLSRMIRQNPSGIDGPLPDPADTNDMLSRFLAEIGHTEISSGGESNNAGSVFWYPEWDNGVSDYLRDHVRVVEKTIGSREGDAYRDALEANRPLVKKIRYAFEFLKPEGLSLLRHWVEGDEFDYRALIDAAIDQQMGRIPSDRLYIKRLKREREVAVLLLVDLSRSTANTVGGTSKTVLDIEREAIVLFCEALQVVGDSFAVAGFSGTGRLGVDYWCVKDFNEPMGDEIRKRINAMAPQRSTRMGAAIRHAASRLEKIPKKVRLLIVLGDGFPNDAGYKGEYAVSDTRRAIAEARAKGIYLRPITVNLIPDQQLDRMYGHRHHTVIADVRELPDKLWRIYSSVTR